MIELTEKESVEVNGGGVIDQGIGQVLEKVEDKLTPKLPRRSK